MEIKKRDRFRLAILVGITFVAVGCSREPRTTSSERQASSVLPKELPVLFAVPAFELTDQTTHDFGTTELTGKIWVANFVFTRCPTTCPRQTANMAALQRRLTKQNAGTDVQLISFTVDPEYDTSEVLATYAKQQARANGEIWRFLTGSKKEIWELCKKGFKLPVADAPAEAVAPIAHSSQFVLVDRQHRVRGFFDGTKADVIDEIYDGIEKLREND